MVSIPRQSYCEIDKVQAVWEMVIYLQYTQFVLGIERKISAAFYRVYFELEMRALWRQ